MRYLILIVGAVAALLFNAGGVQAQTVYVADTGDDNASGTLEEPFRTLDRALQGSPEEVLVKAGDYVFESPFGIPFDTIVRGGFTDAEGEDGETIWVKDTEPTRFLMVGQIGQASLTLRASEATQIAGAALHDVTLVGGFVSVQMEAGTTLREVEIRGGTESGTPGNQLASILVTSGEPDRPVVIDRSRIFGGNNGIRVENTGSATITDTLVRNSLGRAIYVGGSGVVEVDNSILQGAGSDGIGVLGNSNVTVKNSVIRRNSGDGVRITQASPVITGCLIEQNNRGISVVESEAAVVRASTIARNRQSGLYLKLAFPDMHHNIFAYNNYFGVEEDDTPAEDSKSDATKQTTPTPTPTPAPTPVPPLLGGLLEANLFYANGTGNYKEAGNIILDSEQELNELVNNDGTVADNKVANPRFVAVEKGDYRLKENSPAIDQVAPDEGLDKDADGNERTHEVAGRGSDDGSHSQDIGAMEYQDKIITNFGTLSYDISTTTNITDPDGDPVTLKSSPQWLFNPTTAPEFNQISAEFLPGRLRLYTEQGNSFGAVSRSADDVDQPKDKIAIVRATVATLDTIGIRSPRIRVTNDKNSDVVAGYLIEGSKQLFPLLEGREYTWFFDMRQGGYREEPANPDEFYTNDFSVDLLDFSEITYQSKMDLTRLEVEFQSRSLFDAQFNNVLASWDFEEGTQDWSTGGIPIFNRSTMNWDSGRGALKQTQFETDFANGEFIFGSWFSPGFLLEPGTRFRVEATVSSSTDDPANVPGFRFRLSPNDFSYTQEVVIVSAMEGPGLPTTDGNKYVLYGQVPPDISTDVMSTLYFDLMGFNRPLVGSLFLEEVNIYTNE